MPETIVALVLLGAVFWEVGRLWFAMTFRPKGSYKQEDVVDALEGVAPSQPHRVYYHAKHPQMSVLKPGARLVNYIVLLVLFSMMCFAFYVDRIQGP